MTPEALELDFTNEGGACGTIRVLKNISGLWLLQSCRRSWAASGRTYGYEELVSRGAVGAAISRAVRPRQPGLQESREHARRQSTTTVTAPASRSPRLPPPARDAIIESLAFKYRAVLESLEEITGRRFGHIRVVGGGSRNRLLNQFTANATGRPVIAGPVEATALGNVAMQMLATGHVSSLDEARAHHRSVVPGGAVRASGRRAMGPALPRFQGYVELTCA